VQLAGELTRCFLPSKSLKEVSLFQQVLIKSLLKASFTSRQLVGRLLVRVVLQNPPVQREDSGTCAMLSMRALGLGA